MPPGTENKETHTEHNFAYTETPSNLGSKLPCFIGRKAKAEVTGGTQTKNQLLPGQESNSKIQFSNKMRAPFPHTCTRSSNSEEVGRTLPMLIPRQAAAHHCCCGEPPGNGVKAIGRASFFTEPPQKVELTTTGCWRPKVKYGNT